MKTFSKNDLKDALAATGVSRGDLVFFQSRLYGLGMPEGVRTREQLCEFFLQGLLDVIGPEGTLAVPAFTTQVPRFDKPFIMEETVPNYGLFPEYVFRHKDFLRSPHPFLSIAATGPLSEKICRPGNTSNYGYRSAFDVMAKHNAKNIFLGIEIWEAGTVCHYIEMHYGVPYVYNKILKWRPFLGGVADDRTTLAAVRHLNLNVTYDLRRYQRDMFERGVVKSSALGEGIVCTIEWDDMIETGLDGLEKDINYFLAQPVEFRYGEVPYDGPSFSREAGNAGAADACTASLEILRLKAPALHAVAASPAGCAPRAAGVSPAVFFCAASNGMIADCDEIVRLAAAGAGLSPEDIAARISGGAGAALPADIATALSIVLTAEGRRLWDFAIGCFFAPHCMAGAPHVDISGGFLGLPALAAIRSGASQSFLSRRNSGSVSEVEKALETVAEAKDRLHVRPAEENASLPFEDGEAATVSALGISGGLEVFKGLLAEAFRILKPGGALLLDFTAPADKEKSDKIDEAARHISELNRVPAGECEAVADPLLSLFGNSFSLESTEVAKDAIANAGFYIESEIGIETAGECAEAIRCCLTARKPSPVRLTPRP